MTYTRKMQQGIHCLIFDIAQHTGFNTVYIREYFKRLYWGDREGSFSLALGICSDIDAQAFYEVLTDFALDMNIELSTWSNERQKPIGLL